MSTKETAFFADLTKSLLNHGITNLVFALRWEDAEIRVGVISAPNYQETRCHKIFKVVSDELERNFDILFDANPNAKPEILEITIPPK